MISSFELFGLWIMDNLAWFIPAAVGVLAIIVLIIVIPIVVHNKKKKKAQAAANEASVSDSQEQVSATTATAVEREVIYRAEPVYDEPKEVKEEVKEEPVEQEKEEEPAPEEKPVEKKPVEKKPAAKKTTERKVDGRTAAQKALEKARETKALSAKAAANNLAAAEEQSKEPTKPGAKIVAPPTPEKPAKSKKEQPKRVGKWTIEVKADGEYVAKLAATNGEVMLTSEVYSDKDGAIKGISTIIKNIESGKFIVYRDKSDNYYYKLKSAGNRLLCVGEIYQTKDQCERAVQSVQRIAADATIVKEVVEGKYVDYTPIPESEIELPKTPGKWKVEKGEHGYQAKLFAANRQLMLSTEEVSTKKGATDAIETVKEYALQGNFRIDRDKSKRFYWKLRNNQKSVICIGEAYESLDSCFKSLETVRRYVASAVLEN